jgi:hypothetical protein
MHRTTLCRTVLRLLVAIPVLIAHRANAGPSATQTSAPVLAEALTFKELRERGQLAYRAKRFEDACAYWSKAAALRPEDAEVAADLALAFSRVGKIDQAIKANRDAIRLASSTTSDSGRGRRIRLGAYYNLGKLKAARSLSFGEYNDGPSTCTQLVSEPGCSKPVFVCGRDGADGVAMVHTDFQMGRFALALEDARVADGHELVPPLESSTWPEFGAAQARTGDRGDALSYDVTLSIEAQGREPAPEEGSIEVSSHFGTCAVVHVDACRRRLGLYCEWSDWRKGKDERKAAKAVELTFTAPEP